jgi:hypothetical protein
MSHVPHAFVDDRSALVAALSRRLNAARSVLPTGFVWLRAVLDLASKSYPEKTRIRMSPVSDDWLLLHADDEAKHQEDA